MLLRYLRCLMLLLAVQEAWRAEAAVPTGRITQQQGWVSGRRLEYYEFSGAELVTSSDPPATMYHFSFVNDAGILSPIADSPYIADTAILGDTETRSSTAIKYTGIWRIIVVAIPATDAGIFQQLSLQSASDVTSAVQQNGWNLIPQGTFLHCPSVATTATLQFETAVLRRYIVEGAAHYCMVLHNDVLHYPGRDHGVKTSNGSLIAWVLQRLPTPQRVEGNALLEVPPGVHSFIPYFVKRNVNVAATYILNSVTSFAGLSQIPTQFGDDPDIAPVVTWHVSSVGAPFWETTFQHTVALSNLTTLQYTADADTSTVTFLFSTRFGAGWLGLGFSAARSVAELQSVGSETALFYVPQEGDEVCTQFGYVPADSSYSSGIPDPVLSSDNLMGVRNVQMNVLRSGEMYVMFERDFDASAFDSTGKHRPDSDITLGQYGVLTWSVQRGPLVPRCNESWVSLFNSLYQTQWRSVQSLWTDSDTPAQSDAPLVEPPILTPSPFLTAVTAAPVIPFADMHGEKLINTRLSVSWEMQNSREIRFSIKYSGNISAENVWVGIGVGEGFSFADIATVWIDRGGSVRVEDRKSAGLARPVMDFQQDLTLLGTEVTSLSTVINFSRPLTTNDFHTSSLAPTPLFLGREVLIAETIGYTEDTKNFAYVEIETNGGVFGSDGVPKALPVYLLIDEEDEAALLGDQRHDAVRAFLQSTTSRVSNNRIPGQYPLTTALPGIQGYSDIKQVFYAVVPSNYTAGIVSWAHAIPQDWRRGRTQIWLNCPTLSSGSSVRNSYGVKVSKMIMWFRDSTTPTYCIDFGVKMGAFVESPMQSWETAEEVPNTYSVSSINLMWEQLHSEGTAPVAALVNISSAELNSTMQTNTGIFLMQTWQLPDGNTTVINSTSLLPANVSDSASFDPTLSSVTYVNRFILNILALAEEETPAPVEASHGYTREMKVYPAEGSTNVFPMAEIFLRWTVSNEVGVVQVQMEALFDARYEPGYVGIGFSDVGSTQMTNADLVVGMSDRHGASCIRSAYSDQISGPPDTSRATMTLADQKIEVTGRKIVLSFTRGYTGSAHDPEGYIPEDPFTAARVLYAAGDSRTTGECGAGTIDITHIHSNGIAMRGSTDIYWKLTTGNASIPNSPPSVGLPLPLDKPATYTQTDSFFLNSKVSHYIVKNTLTETTENSGLLNTMYVYELWHPVGRLSIIDSVPGLSDYSDVMKVRRVRLPDQLTDDITSLAELRAVDAYVEETDYYWDCPVVSALAQFEQNDSKIELRQLWYQGQVVNCAFFSNLTHNTIDKMYEIYEEDESVVLAPAVQKYILGDIPSSVQYSPIKIVYSAVVPKGARDGINSATDLLAVTTSLQRKNPLEIVNIKIMSIDPGEAIALKAMDIALQKGWYNGVQNYYIDLSDPGYYQVDDTPMNNGVTGRMPIVDEKSIVTAEVFCLRRPSDAGAAAYWAPETQANIASVVPGQTGYSHIWKATLVTVPDVHSTPLPITSIDSIPSSWVRTSTSILITCAVSHSATTVTKDGTPFAIPRLSWYWNDTTIECLFVSQGEVPRWGAINARTYSSPFETYNEGWEVLMRGTQQLPLLADLVPGRVYETEVATQNGRVFNTLPFGGTTGLVRPYVYAPAAVAPGGDLYRSEAAVLGMTVVEMPWALNYPVLDIDEKVEQSMLEAKELPEYNLALPRVGYYRGKILNFWPVVNASFRYPLTLPTEASQRTNVVPYESTYEIPVNRVYIFLQNERVLDLLPVFEAIPANERIVNGSVVGYSDLVELQEVLIPSGETAEQVTSVLDISRKRWPARKRGGIYYHWPVCSATTQPPSGVTLSVGYHKSYEIYFMQLAEQSVRTVLRAYRVKSGKILLPYLPESPLYSVFHTLWAAPDSPDTFDPTTDLLSQSTYPINPASIHAFPILSAPSASTQSNEVDEKKVYEKRSAYVSGRPGLRVFFYALMNTPLPFSLESAVGNQPISSMSSYALRFNETVFTAAEAQNYEIVSRSAGQAGYSDLHSISVVEIPQNGDYAATAFPIKSESALLSETLQKTWTVVASSLSRLTPAIHPASVLAERAHRYLFPTVSFYHNNQELTGINFGYFENSDPEFSTAFANPTILYKVVNAQNKISYVMSRAIGGTCLEVIRLAEGTNEHPITAVDSTMKECAEKLSEVTCPREHCFWNGTCHQPVVHYTCPTVSHTSRSAPLVTLSREKGYYADRPLWYYSSPNAVPGNMTHALADRVFVFRHPTAVTVREAEGLQNEDAKTGATLYRFGEAVAALAPVFENLPSGANDDSIKTLSDVAVSFSLNVPFEDTAASNVYSDVHKLVIVEVPRNWLGDGTDPVSKAFGGITTVSDVLEVVQRESWKTYDTEQLVNLWVVDPLSSLEPQDATTVPKLNGWAEGVKIAYFNFGLVDTLALKEKFVPTRNADPVANNAIFTQAKTFTRASDTLYSTLFWDVSVPVDANYAVGNLTSTSQLAGMQGDYSVLARISNNPMVVLDPPISPFAYDDLAIDPLVASQVLLWGYGGIDPETQEIQQCTDRGSTQVAYRASTSSSVGSTPVPFAAGGQSPEMKFCHDFVVDEFRLCWVVNTASTPKEIWVTIMLKAEMQGAVGISLEPGMRNTDVWKVDRDITIDPDDSMLQDCWAGDVEHNGAVLPDSQQGGTPGLTFISFEETGVRDKYTVKFKRPLLTTDAVADVSLANASLNSYYVSYAYGPADQAMHTTQGTVCIHFEDGTVDSSCVKESMPYWWIDFTVLYLTLMACSGYYVTRYSPKNFLWRVSVLFQVWQ